MDAPAGATVASVRAEALRSPRDALAALSVAASGLAAGAEGAGERYAAALAHAERLGAWDAERRLEAALNAFDAHFHAEQALAGLSVGQRYRLRLGCALADPAGSVLLDEPSNHLDDSSLDRLVQWLVEFPGIAVFVTHDRWLLDAVATAIFDLDPALGPGGTLFGGSFAAYREARAGTLREWRRRHAASLDAERELSDAVDRRSRRGSGPLAARQGRGQARTREPSGEFGSAAPAPHRRAPTRARARSAGSAHVHRARCSGHGRRDPARGRRNRRTRSRDPAVRLADPARRRGRLLLRGANGAGKSTLLSVLAGQLAPDTGTLTVAPGAHVGLLAQEDDWNPNRTPADVLGAWDLDQIRATGLLLDADLGRPFGRLSVGQRRRVTLARVLLSRPSVLLLDEPTNHLSVTLVDELCDALLSTPAAVVLVTHDRTLRRMVHDWPTVTLSPTALAGGGPEGRRLA